MSEKALFLDRDGVINVDHGYVCTPERTDFIDGIFDLCRVAGHFGYLVVVITNQAGIARGYYTEQQFLDYMDWMRGVFQEHAAPLDAVYFCPHHPLSGVGDYRRVCDCRKPAPGMILAAQRELDVDLRHSILIGDKPWDLQAGRAAGVGTCLDVHAVASTQSAQVVLDPTKLQNAMANPAGAT